MTSVKKKSDIGLGDNEEEDCWQPCTVSLYFYDSLPAVGGLLEAFPNTGGLFVS